MEARDPARRVLQSQGLTEPSNHPQNQDDDSSGNPFVLPSPRAHCPSPSTQVNPPANPFDLRYGLNSQSDRSSFTESQHRNSPINHLSTIQDSSTYIPHTPQTVVQVESQSASRISSSTSSLSPPPSPPPPSNLLPNCFTFLRPRSHRFLIIRQGQWGRFKPPDPRSANRELIEAPRWLYDKNERRMRPYLDNYERRMLVEHISPWPAGATKHAAIQINFEVLVDLGTSFNVINLAALAGTPLRNQASMYENRKFKTLELEGQSLLVVGEIVLSFDIDNNGIDCVKTKVFPIGKFVKARFRILDPPLAGYQGLIGRDTADHWNMSQSQRTRLISRRGKQKPLDAPGQMKDIATSHQNLNNEPLEQPLRGYVSGSRLKNRKPAKVTSPGYAEGQAAHAAATESSNSSALDRIRSLQNNPYGVPCGVTPHSNAQSPAYGQQLPPVADQFAGSFNTQSLSYEQQQHSGLGNIGGAYPMQSSAHRSGPTGGGYNPQSPAHGHQQPPTAEQFAGSFNAQSLAFGQQSPTGLSDIDGTCPMQSSAHGLGLTGGGYNPQSPARGQQQQPPTTGYTGG